MSIAPSELDYADDTIFFVPKAPEWQPSVEAARAATEALMSLAMSAGSIVMPWNCRFDYPDRLEMYHPYENFEGARCPHCGTELDDWFYAELDREFPSDGKSLERTTPCCRRRTSLNDLDFAWAVAFGRFALVLENVNVDIDDRRRASLADLLGADVTIVRQHL